MAASSPWPCVVRAARALLIAAALGCSGASEPSTDDDVPRGGSTGGGIDAPGGGGAGGMVATAGAGGGGASGSSGKGGDGASGSGAGGTTSAAGNGSAALTGAFDACSSYFDTICDRLVECGMFPREECALRSEACPDRLFAEGSAWTLERVGQCEAEWKSFDCSEVEKLRVPPCARLPGTLADGEACIADDQCQSGGCSAHFVHQATCGTCVPVVEAGAPCGPMAECAPGLHCDPMLAMCVDNQPTPFGPVTPAALGEPCTSSSNCEGDLACEAPPAGVTEGRCVETPPQGSPCFYDIDGFGQCEQGATCPSPDLATCQPLSQLNEPCGWALCVEGLYCNTIGDDFGESHSCLEPRKAGEPCVHDSPFRRETSVCAQGLECMYTDDTRTEARCMTRRELGQSCDAPDAQCRPGTRCESAVCVGAETRGLYQSTCMVSP